MKVLLITFQAVAALLGIGVLGFWIIGRRRIPANALGLLNSIAIDIALPCLVLANILVQFSPKQYAGWWQMPLWWLGFSVVALALSLASSFLVKKELRGVFSMSLFFQNGIFFPLLIIIGLFNQPAHYLVQLFLFIFIQPSVVFSVYPLFFRGKPQQEKVNWRRVVNPVLVVTVIGLVLGLIDIKGDVPSFLTMMITMIGAMATPLFMLILGGNVYNDFQNRTGDGAGGRAKIYTSEVIKFTLVKNVLFPLVFLGLIYRIHPEFSIAFILMVQAAIPPITALPIFAERSGGNRAIASQFIVASFVFSIVSIPAMILLFSRFFPFPA